MEKIILYNIKLLPYLLLIVLNSCKVIEDYRIDGEITFKGSIENEIGFHEHFLDSGGFNHCHYHHDTITEDFEITVENIKKVKRLVWYKK